MQNWLTSWGYLILCGVAAGALIWVAIRRYLRYLHTYLAEDTRDNMADLFLGHLRTSSPGPNEPIGLDSTFWPSFGWSHDEALRLLQYLQARGLLLVPGFNILKDGILWGGLPTRVALTRSSYDQYSPQRHSVVINGNLFGPTHLGTGDIVNEGTISYAWTGLGQELNELALNLHHEAQRQTGELAALLKARAEILAEAADSGTPHTPIVKATLKWVVDLSNSTAAGVISAGIVAAASAILAKL
jgi:hypothetical protein